MCVTCDYKILVGKRVGKHYLGYIFANYGCEKDYTAA
jgi:hypothetical protein